MDNVPKTRDELRRKWQLEHDICQLCARLVDCLTYEGSYGGKKRITRISECDDFIEEKGQ